jgi:hypothetical protein
MSETHDGNGEARYAVWSDSLGLMPCEVVGRNRSHYLVRVQGATLPAETWQVFQLADGLTVRNGRIVPVDGEGTEGAIEAALSLFAPPVEEPAGEEMTR